jgi:hypothetical protein
MLVGRYRYEADDPDVEAQGTVGIVLEYVGDDVGVAAVEDASIAARINATASRRLPRCAASTVKRPTSAMRFRSREALNIEARVENRQVILGVRSRGGS